MEMKMKPYSLLGLAPATVGSPKSTTPEKSMKESEDEQTMKGDWFFFVPDDILFDILKRVPDTFLRYKHNYVCTRWFDMITNRILLDNVSFIVQDSEKGRRTARLVDIREEGQVKEQKVDLPPTGVVLFWCNEILLMARDRYRESLYVFNLITKEGSHLPECIISCPYHNHPSCGMAISFDRFEGIYKVVHLFLGPPVECEIFVLKRGGIVCRVSSKWKKIQGPHTNIYRRMELSVNPVSVQGRYLHWRIQASNYLISVDTVKEQVWGMILPSIIVYSLFEMGGFLAFFGGVSHDKLDIWLLKDFHMVKWEKLQSICVDNSYFERHPDELKRYSFRGMISKRYVIVNSTSTAEPGMYSYDLKHGVMKKLDIRIGTEDEYPVLHSLAPPWKPKAVSH